MSNKGRCVVCGKTKKLQAGKVVYHERTIRAGNIRTMKPCEGSLKEPKK
jgi:hypothetical protein